MHPYKLFGFGICRGRNNFGCGTPVEGNFDVILMMYNKQILPPPGILAKSYGTTRKTEGSP